MEEGERAWSLCPAFLGKPLCPAVVWKKESVRHLESVLDLFAKLFA
jgi:hypothetical protein